MKEIMYQDNLINGELNLEFEGDTTRVSISQAYGQDRIFIQMQHIDTFVEKIQDMSVCVSVEERFATWLSYNAEPIYENTINTRKWRYMPDESVKTIKELLYIFRTL